MDPKLTALTPRAFCRWHSHAGLLFSCACRQAIVISHELSNPDEYDTHLTDMLTPLRPLICMGRSRLAGPSCRPDESLFHFWKDRLSSIF